MPSVNAFAAINNTPGASPPQTKNDAGSEDRFLKLLVAQMSNQDPLNPIDNAQVTSQMAQISTVNGIDKLNGTVQGLNRQFVQMQALQGAALVGRDVILPGDRLAANDAGLIQGGFELTAAASNVNPVEEMVNMISASRSYQNNIEVMSTARSLLLKTLQIGQA